MDMWAGKASKTAGGKRSGLCWLNVGPSVIAPSQPSPTQWHPPSPPWQSRTHPAALRCWRTRRQQHRSQTPPLGRHPRPARWEEKRNEKNAEMSSEQKTGSTREKPSTHAARLTRYETRRNEYESIRSPNALHWKESAATEEKPSSLAPSNAFLKIVRSSVDSP